jgi:hypothetical protein
VSAAMHVPVVATTLPKVQGVGNGNGNSKAQAPVAKEDGLELLRTAFPEIDDEMLQSMYEVNGFNVVKTKAMISNELGLYTEEDEYDGVAPEDVEFNMIAGQMNNDAFTEEERKMIEKAVRESQAQEGRRPEAPRQEAPRQVIAPVHHHAVNSANMQQQKQRQNPQQAVGEGIVNESGSISNRDRKIKQQKKVEKNGNQC